MADGETTDLTALTVQLLSAYVANNSVPSNELGDLIQSTRAALAEQAAAPAAEAAEEFKPAVSVRKSLASGDHILSLIDGRPYKTLKRHLKTHGLTPAQYRERYKLARDYPMVAPSYSDHRREVAQRLGLGRKPAASEAPAEAPAVEAPAAEAPAPAAKEAKAAAPKTRGRQKRAAAPAPAAAAPEAEAAPAPARKGRKPATAKAAPPAAVESAAAAPAPRRRKNAAAASDAPPPARRTRKRR